MNRVLLQFIAILVLSLAVMSSVIPITQDAEEAGPGSTENAVENSALIAIRDNNHDSEIDEDSDLIDAISLEMAQSDEASEVAHDFSLIKRNDEYGAKDNAELQNYMISRIVKKSMSLLQGGGPRISDGFLPSVHDEAENAAVDPSDEAKKEGKEVDLITPETLHQDAHKTVREDGEQVTPTEDSIQG